MPTEFGVSLHSGENTASFAKLAEEQGLDYLACGEHLAFHGPVTNAFIELSVAAGATESIKLLSAITLLPLYPPVLAAKLATILDVASNGRFHLGVGIGGENPREFQAVGVPVAERGARTDEALEIIHRLMTEDDVTFEGRFTSFTGLTLAPKPTQKPRLPFWIAGRRTAAMRRAARFGQAWMPYLYTPEMVADSRAEIQRLAREAGATSWDGLTAVHVFTTVDSDGNEARRVAAERVGRTYQQDFTGSRSRYLVAGTPAECVSQFREYLDAGVDVILFRLTCASSQAPSMLQLIADEVIPELRGASAGSAERTAGT
ncbi:MAG: LLM class flavin-dependent oxidoreductase [Actinomycetota bacterium]|nr:LLM class flavin-dependent oxidoreductase [Actinomycetota bacterium]